MMGLSQYISIQQYLFEKIHIAVQNAFCNILCDTIMRTRRNKRLDFLQILQ